MFHFVTQYCVSHLCGALFIDEFSGVTAHEDNGGFLCKLSLQVLHVREHMQTVDAAVGPEVDEHQFVLELISEREGLRVQPHVASWEVLSF